MDDDLAELLEAAKLTVARAHGLAERDAHRLAGTTMRELHDDARQMAKEVGAYDPTQRECGDDGRYTQGERPDLNTLIRRATGRLA